MSTNLRCPTCRRWTDPDGGGECDCHAVPLTTAEGYDGHPAAGTIPLMSAKFMQTAAPVPRRNGELSRQRRAEDDRWQARHRGCTLPSSAEANFTGHGAGVVNSGVIGGGLAMFAAMAWFILGIVYLDTLYFYPPVLFVLGLAGVMKGVLGGLKG